MKSLEGSRGSAVDVAPSVGTEGFGGPVRFVVAILTLAVALPFAMAAMAAVDSSPVSYGDKVVWQLRAMVYGPLAMLVMAVAAKRFQVTKAIYWAWSLVFLGLAPAIQISRQSFPWKAVLQTSVIEDSQSLVLTGHVAFALVAWGIGRRTVSTSDENMDGADAERHDQFVSTIQAKQARVLSYLGLAYFVSSVLFVALMGGALFNARAVFRSRVLEIAALPLGGFLYFAVTAGAIVIPGALLACRRHGVRVPVWLVVASWSVAAVVTNPLVGSRFLTGSFLVATAVALLYRSSLLRLVPIGSVVLLIVVFPTLDVLRGDSTGAQAVQVLSIENSLLDYDFDAFEMGAREVSMNSSVRDTLPTPAHMLIAPFARWVPILSRPYIGDAGGQVVASATGMQYTNVSMPLWAEGHLIAGTAGTVLTLGALGAWVGLAGRGGRTRFSVPQVAALPGSTALLFIVLRGSIYEVLGYLALAVIIYTLLARLDQENENA